MLLNRPKRRRRRRANPLLVNRKRRRRAVRVRHYLANPRRRSAKRRGRRRSGGGALMGVGKFFSAAFLREAGMGALGAVTPTLVTDRLLPMVGFVTSGLTRRLIQLAVPTAVLMIGGRRLLGGGAHAFTIGAYAVTVVGLVNDFTGGLAPALSGMGRYALPAPGLGGGVGRYDRTPAVLYAR